MALTPLEKVIQQALAHQGCTATELALKINMAPTNFSLARNLKRSFPLPALLNLFTLAGLTAEAKVQVLEWVAFEHK